MKLSCQLILVEEIWVGLEIELLVYMLHVKLIFRQVKYKRCESEFYLTIRLWDGNIMNMSFL